jgi:UDP-N-acetylmuramate dehydrogenase
MITPSLENITPTQLPLIQEHVSLADKNWFGTGGIARFFCEPTTIEQFQEALTFAHQHNLAIFVLGEGANVLISDDGFNGLVIRPALRTITHSAHKNQETLLQAGAGVPMNALIEYCLAHNLLGLEEFSGIPGTVGGSVYINLHYFEFLLAQFLVSGTVINHTTGAIETVTNEWFAFGYDNSRLHAQEYYLLNATFKVRLGTDLEIAYASGRRKEIIRHRISRYPTKNTCGSFFRNFHEHEVTLTSNGKKMIYVAYYLDKIGVKGQLWQAGASVSYQHANMLVHNGSASSTDLINLARHMQKLVLQEFNIIPQPECILIGFDTYPLLS